MGIESYPSQRLLQRCIRRNAIKLSEESQILHAGEFIVDERSVSHVTHVRKSFATLFSEDLNPPMRGPAQAGNNAHQGGFAGAIFSAQDVKPPWLQFQRHVSQRRSAAVDLGNILYLDG